MLEVLNMNIKYNELNILNISKLKLGAGIYFLKGENGSGKTSLFNALVKEVEFEGLIKFNNKDIKLIKNDEVYRNYVSYHTQFNKDIDNIKVIEYLKFKTSNLEMDRLKLYCEIVNFDLKYLNYKFSKLSGGNKQKVSIISTLMCDTLIYLFDEPENNIDIDIVKIIKKIDFSNKIVIVATHDEIVITDEVIEIIDCSIDYIGNELNETKVVTNNRKSFKDYSVIVKRNKLFHFLLSCIMGIAISLTFITLIFNFNIISQVLQFNDSNKYSDTSLVINSPLNSDLFLSYGDESWLEKHPQFLSDEEKAYLESLDYVEKVIPIGAYNYFIGGNYTEDMNVVGHEYMTKNEDGIIKYQSQVDPYSYNSNVPNYKVRFPKMESLITGTMPMDETNEVIINNVLADQLLKFYNMGNYEELFTEEIEFLLKDVDSEQIGRGFSELTNEAKPIKYKITGVFKGSSYYTENEAVLSKAYDKDSIELSYNNIWLEDDVQHTIMLLNSMKQGLEAESSTDINTNQYPSLYVEVKEESDIKTLTKLIKDNDKYVEVLSNDTNKFLNAYSYVSEKFNKAVLTIIGVFCITMILILVLHKRYNLKLSNIEIFLKRCGYNQTQITKFKIKDLKQLSFIYTFLVLLTISVINFVLVIDNFDILMIIISYLIIMVIFLAAIVFKSKNK